MAISFLPERNGHPRAYWATNTAQGSQGQYIAVLHDNGNFPSAWKRPVAGEREHQAVAKQYGVRSSRIYIKVVSGNNQNLKGTMATIRLFFAPLVVQVRQQNGQPAPHVPVNFGLAGTGGPTDMMFTPAHKVHVPRGPSH